MPLPAILVAAALAVLAGSAPAQESEVEEYYADDILVTNTYVYYSVTGSSLPDLMDDMAAKGPAGHWAYTEWYVNWTGGCDVRVDTTITLPDLDKYADLSDEDFAEWDRMIEALVEHELGHVENGIGFARDVAAAGCDVDVDAVLAPWNQADIDYDAETDHGILTGATLYLD